MKKITRYVDDYLVMCHAQPGAYDSIVDHVVKTFRKKSGG